jgi:hypothetical protein
MSCLRLGGGRGRQGRVGCSEAEGRGFVLALPVLWRVSLSFLLGLRACLPSQARALFSRELAIRFDVSVLDAMPIA